MDQIRAFLRVVWRQRFWVLSVVGLLVGVACWYLASADIDEQTLAETSKITGAHSGISSLNNVQYHGNRAVNDKEMEEVGRLGQSVGEMWQELYRAQRDHVLTWPDVLEQKFHTYINRKSFGDTLSNEFRSAYGNYIEGRFDQLLTIVEARKLEDAFGAADGRGSEGYSDGYGRGGGTGYGVEEEEEDYLVEWYDQVDLRAKLVFPNARPESVQIWVTQENLWVYETLLKIIADVNQARGATRPDNTAISSIVQLQVGADAAISNQSSQSNIIGLSGGASAGMDGGYGEGRGGYDGGRGGYDGGRGGYEGGRGGYGEGRGGYDGGAGGDMSAAEMEALLLEGRYIDATGEPVIGDLADPNSFGVEFRRLPVRMVLTIDPKWIPTLLVECANAPLPVEAELLRINGSLSGVGFESAMGGGGGRGGYEGGGRDGGRGDYGGAAGRGAATSMGASMGQPQQGTVELELQGVVYIFNPPDPVMLRPPGADDPSLASN